MKFNFLMTLSELKYFNKKEPDKIKKNSAIFVMNQAKFILEINLLITKMYFLLYKNAGIFFQKKINILV